MVSKALSPDQQTKGKAPVGPLWATCWKEQPVRHSDLQHYGRQLVESAAGAETAETGVGELIGKMAAGVSKKFNFKVGFVHSAVRLDNAPDVVKAVDVMHACSAQPQKGGGQGQAG